MLRYNQPYNPNEPRPSSSIPEALHHRTSYSIGDDTFSLSPGTQMIRFGAGYVPGGRRHTHYQFVNTLKASWGRPHRSLKGTVQRRREPDLQRRFGRGIFSISAMGGIKPPTRASPSST